MQPSFYPNFQKPANCNPASFVPSELHTLKQAESLKEIYLAIFKKLGENEISSSKELDAEAKKSGIEDPEAALSQFIGDRALKKPNLADERERNHLILKTFLENTHLSVDFSSICKNFSFSSLSAERIDLEGEIWLSNLYSPKKSYDESIKEMLSSAEEELSLSKKESKLFSQTLLFAMEESPFLKPCLAPFIQSLCRKDYASLDFTGSQDRLLVSFLIATLKKETPKTIEKLLVFQALPDRIALKLNTALTAYGKEAGPILSDLCRISKIYLQMEGHARNSWEMFAKSQFSKMEERKNSSPLAQELSKKWSTLEKQQAESKTTNWIKNLKNEGWIEYKILGRTHIYKSSTHSKFLAIKWQKQEEDKKELFKEMATLDVVRKHQKSLGLLSQFPKPLGVFSFKGPMPKGYFDNTEVDVLAAKSQEEKVAYLYETGDDSYFTYLHDPEGMEENYKIAKTRMIADLFTLAKNGLIMTQLADLFHRSETSRSTRDDSGRFLAMNFLLRAYSLSEIPGEDDFTGIGNGRLHHIETAVKYPNAGYSGLRDIGDASLLEELADPEFPLSKKHFSRLQEKNSRNATTSILANFLAEYLLVYELIITERQHKKKENQLDWKDPQKVESLANELKEGFILAMRYYGQVSNTVVSRFIKNSSIDWKRAAKQLHFFSRKDKKGYLAYPDPQSIPKEILENIDDRIEKNCSYWYPAKDMEDSTKTRNRGTFSGTDPVKEPEKARVILLTHMLLLDDARQRAKELKSLAEEKWLQGQYKEAKRLCEESLEFWPFESQVHRLASKVYGKLGEHEKKEESLREWAALTIQNQRESILRQRIFLQSLHG